MVVCDSCLTAVLDEHPEVEAPTARLLAVEVGNEMSDHLCDSREDPSSYKDGCSCACNLRRDI